MNDGDRGQHQFIVFYIFIELVPISEQHLAAWQSMPYMLDPTTSESIRQISWSVSSTFPFGPCPTGHWKEAGVIDHRDKDNPRARVEGLFLS